MPTKKAANRKSINLALQGGGAHGAFAWGVCDRLLEDGRLSIEAITATSAGAMNAAVLAYGYHLDEADGARAKLEEFWREVSRVKERFGVYHSPFTALFPYMEQIQQQFNHFWMEAATLTSSPYQFNPFGINPLREVLETVIDFPALNSCKRIDLFISATNVETGKVKVFSKTDLTPEHLLASACLPQLFHAIEIEGQHYWDGGYMGNPSLWPLFYETDVSDLLMVHINPIERKDVPQTPSEISNRLNEITFNSALLKEMRAVAFVQKLLNDGWIKDEFRDKLSNILFHAIRAEEVFLDLSLSSKYETRWKFLTDLRDKGRDMASEWLDENFDAVGKRGTVDLHQEFLDT